MKLFLKGIVVWVMTLEARMLLWRRKPKVIAITGSVGKTSVKDAIYAVIHHHVHTRKSEKSFNSEIGVPLSILGLPNAWNSLLGWIRNIVDGGVSVFFGRYPEWLVLEVGVDHPGDMKRITSWLKPDIVVLTRLPDVPVHVEFFDGPEAVIEEKKVLVDALKEDGVLVYNNDDERVREVANGIRQKSVGYGRYAPTDITMKGDTIAYQDDVPHGVECSVTHNEEEKTFHLHHTVGVQHTYTIGAAVAVASLLDISLSESQGAFTAYQPPRGRMRVLRGVKDTTVIDDTYNSSPVAATRAVETLSEIRTKGRKIVVLGDMLELGRFSIEAHKDLGELVQKSGIDILMTVGVRARGVAEGALNAGMHEKNIFQYEEAPRAGKELEMKLKEGDVVLVKGSQGVRLERVVEEVMAEPERANELLVRQDSFWKEI